MPPNKEALKKFGAKGRSVLAEIRAIMSEEATLVDLKERLHISVQHAQKLEGDLLKADLVHRSMDTNIKKLKQENNELTAQILHWKAKHKSVYHELRMARQAMKRGSTQQGVLEKQIQVLKDAAVNSQAQSTKCSRQSRQAIALLTKVNEDLHSELSDSLGTWTNQLEVIKEKLQKARGALKISQKEVTRLSKATKQAAGVKDRAVASARSKVTQQMSVHHLMRKGVFTEETRNVVRLLVKAGCSGKYINEVLKTVLQAAGIEPVGRISRPSVSRIIREGYIAAKIQLGHEIKTAESLTLSADGTSHRSINYNSRHIHLLAEDYNLSNSETNNQKTKHRRTRFLGIKPSRDNSSEEAIADWKATIDDILDLYSRSPFGKRMGSLIKLIDVLIKITGMNTDHCAKEKKDARKMEELKCWAVDQRLGEEALLDKTVEEVDALYTVATKEMIKKAGGPSKWQALSSDVRAAKQAIMVEDIVSELGKEAFAMLSDHEQRLLHLFIWAGCGCHKDLNTIRGGYKSMAQWWQDNDIEGPVLLANRDNNPVLRERAEAIEHGDETTPAQDRAFSQTTQGAIKMAEIAGAIFNHKDDKKGHHDLFRWWWFEHVGTSFTFPDTSNNRFQSYCNAAAALILHSDHFIQFLENLRDNKQGGTLNHMESNLWDALHCDKTRSELAVLALYAESVSYPYMKAIRAPENTQNMLDLGPLHCKVGEHMEKIINDPDILIKDGASPENASLDGQEWQNAKVVQTIHELAPTLPYFKELLIAFFEGAQVTWSRFTSEFAPGGLIDEAMVEEKELAWLPATNDENEGALGAFRCLIGRQPQLSLQNYNALAMFFQNDTQAFMAANFTEEEDYRFLHKLARESQGLEKKQHQELVKFRDEKQAKKKARKEKHRANAERTATEIEKVSLVLDKIIAQALKGDALTIQIKKFRAKGAPNLLARLPMRAPEKRDALVAAIELYESGEWEIEESDSESYMDEN